MAATRVDEAVRGGRAARVRAVLVAAAGAIALAAPLAGCESLAMSTTNMAGAPPMLGAPSSASGPGRTSVDLRGYRIAVRSGKPFEVRLPGNRASGYRWELVDPVPSMVRTLGVARDEIGRTEVAGATGTETFSFEAVGSGTAPLLFEYRRPAEPETPPAQRASFRVEVR